MISHPEPGYDMMREAAERAAAVVATNAAARQIHLELARRYAGRASAAEGAGLPSEAY